MLIVLVYLRILLLLLSWVVAEADLRWHGPRTLAAVRQVCISVALLRALNLDVGSELQFALDEENREIRIRAFGSDGRGESA